MCELVNHVLQLGGQREYLLKLKVVLFIHIYLKSYYTFKKIYDIIPVWDNPKHNETCSKDARDLINFLNSNL